jgi:hypothetical protein
LTGWLQTEVERLADTPQRRALAVFDALHEWFGRPDFDSCTLISRRRDTGTGDRVVPMDNADGLGVTAATLEGYAQQAGAANPHETARQLQLLMLGAIVSAGSGDDEAARRARSLAELVLDGSRP